MDSPEALAPVDSVAFSARWSLCIKKSKIERLLFGYRLWSPLSWNETRFFVVGVIISFSTGPFVGLLLSQMAANNAMTSSQHICDVRPRKDHRGVAGR
jgi:hypothetical protein